MRIKLYWRWYDLFIGGMWDTNSRKICSVPIPIIEVRI